jgi:hypothetical protein
MSDFSKRVVLETRDAERALQRIDREAMKARLGLTKIGTDGAKAMNTIGLGAEAQVPRLERLHSALQGFTGKIGQGIGAIDKFSKSMAPWNQTIELVGKGIRFLEAGLGAHAKTSERARLEVEALTKEMKEYKDAVMETVGAVTVELLKPVGSIDKQREAMEKLLQTYRKGGLGAFGTTKIGMFGDDETRDALGDLGDALGNVRKAIASTVDHWNTSGTTFVDKFSDGMEKTAAATKKAADEHARWRAEYAAHMETLRLREQRNYTDTRTQSRPGFQIDTSLLDQDAQIGSALDAFNEQTSRGARYAASQTSRNETFLAKTFGPVEEFNLYKEAFAGLTTAVGGAMSAWIDGSMSAGQAIKKFISEALKGLAIQMGIESLKHGAYAIGSAAFYDYAGAAKHAQAAAAFALGALAAGGGARALGGGGGAGASAGGGGASSAGSSTPVQSGVLNFGKGNSGKSNVVVVYADPFAEGSPGTRRRNARKVMERARGGSDWEDS